MVKKMVNMARSVEQAQESPANLPRYNYGLCISLDNESLEKLDLDHSDVGVGDMLHLFAMAEVTSVSKNDTGAGEQCRIELQLTHIGLESEDEENEYEAE